jgi:hypothetical protein
MGAFPHFGQASPAPAGPGPARKLAEHHSSPASGYGYSWKVRDPGKTYPGRLVFHPADAALYTVSARKGSAGKISLYGVEGADVGKWKDVGLDAFNSGYRVVDEDEGIAIRNLVPANVPVGDIRTVNILYPTTLLSSAVISIGESFPTSSTIDPVKAAEQQQKMLEGTLFAALLATEAIDVAGAAYDALRIGKNALNLIRDTALQMLVFLDAILKLVSKPASLEAVQNATALADRFMAQAPLWGLYLDRAYLWTQSSDLAEMTRIVRDARQVDGVMFAVLNAIDKKRDYLVKQGVSVEAMTEAKAYAESILQNATAKDLNAESRINAYLKRNKISEKSLDRALLAMDKYLDINAKSIKDLFEGKNKEGGTTSLGDYFIGFLGANVRRVLPKNIELVHAGRVATSVALKTGREIPEGLRPHAIDVLGRLLEFSFGPMNSLAATTRAHRETGLKEAEIPKIIAEMNVRRDEAIKSLELEKAKTNPDPNEIGKWRAALATIEQSLRVAQMDSALIEPAHVKEYLDLLESNRNISNTFKGATGSETIKQAFGYIVTGLIGERGKKFIFADLNTPEQRKEFISLVSDIQHVFDITPNMMNMFVYKIVERSLPGLKESPRTPEEIKATVETIYGEAQGLLETQYGALANSIGAELASGVRAYIKAGEDAASLIKHLEDPNNPTRPTPEQVEVIKKFITPIGDYMKTRDFIAALEGQLAWPDGVITHMNEVLASLKGRMPNDKFRALLGNVRKVEERIKQIEGFGANRNLKDDELTELADKRGKLPDLRAELGEQMALRKENAALVMLYRAMNAHNHNIANREKKVEAVKADPTATPEVKAAAVALEAAVAAEKPAAAEASAALTETELKPTSDPNVLKIVETKIEKEVETGKAAETAETNLDIEIISDTVAARGGTPGGPEGPGTPGAGEYSAGSDRPLPEENPGRERVTVERATTTGAPTKLTKTLYGLGAAVAIAALLGLGAALSGRTTPDPKSTDPIVPPPASNVETALKIGGVVAGGALLLYLLFGRRQESKTPAKAQLKR